MKFEPVRFVDIDAYFDEKVAAINAYASQTEQRSYLEEDLVRATARYWGRFGRSRYSEPLEVVRDRPPQARRHRAGVVVRGWAGTRLPG